MKSLNVSKEFVVGKNDISWIGSNFKERLYGLTFTMPEDSDLEIKTLGNRMNDKEIIAGFNPEPVTLGDVLAFFKEKATKDGWYVCHVKGSNGVLWAVFGYWDVVGWSFEAYALGYPGRWFDGVQFLSRRFGAKKLSSGSSDTQNLGNFESRLKALEEWRERIAERGLTLWL